MNRKQPIQQNTWITTEKRIFFLLLLFIFLFPVICFADSQITSNIPSSGLEYSDLPEYAGDDIIIINKNTPKLSRSQKKAKPFVHFSPLDELGRTGTGLACLGPETLPKTSRGQIGNVRPSGWHTVRYDDLITDKYLYNRSHVLGFLLTGDSSTPENLFTGTSHLYAESMTLYEIPVAQYIEKTGNHVLYRVTPVYKGDDLVATGVQMEAFSIEDRGNGICFNVFVYNVQPGIIIDYKTGDSRRDTGYPAASEESVPVNRGSSSQKSNDQTENSKDGKKEPAYIINTKTRKFHSPDCSSVADTKPKNRKDFYGDREELILAGYAACKSCKP